jgi:hypothetical protein
MRKIYTFACLLCEKLLEPLVFSSWLAKVAFFMRQNSNLRIAFILGQWGVCIYLSIHETEILDGLEHHCGNTTFRTMPLARRRLTSDEIVARVVNGSQSEGKKRKKKKLNLDRTSIHQ